MTLQTIKLESSGLRGVLGLLTSMLSFTVDMDTQNGLGLIPKVAIDVFVQSWRWAEPSIVSQDGGGDNSCMMTATDGATANVPPDFSEHLFVWAVGILGIIDKMSAMSEHMMNSLMCIDRIRLSFAALCSILNHSHVRERIRRTCIENREQLCDSAFRSEVPLAVRWRWSSVQLCFSAWRKATTCLIAHWRLHKYVADKAENADMGNEDTPAAEAEDAQKQHVEMLVMLRRADEAIRDPKFWMLLYC